MKAGMAAWGMKEKAGRHWHGIVKVVMAGTRTNRKGGTAGRAVAS